MPTTRLARRLDLVSRRLIKATELIVSNIGEGIAEELVPDTPVDTGLARGNWRPSLNAPALLPVTITDPSGQATISRIRTVARLFRVGDTLYIQNNLDYIEDLNRGKSAQASADFVRASVQSGVRSGIVRLSGGLNL